MLANNVLFAIFWLVILHSISFLLNLNTIFVIVAPNVLLNGGRVVTVERENERDRGIQHTKANGANFISIAILQATKSV